MAAVTPTDRPKSVRNCCVIKVFGGVFYVVTLLFGLFCGCRGFCHRTESDLFLFLLLLSISKDGQLGTSLNDKRDDINFHITIFSFQSSYFPSLPAYGVLISQHILYARACSSYEFFYSEGSATFQ